MASAPAVPAIAEPTARTRGSALRR
jgi:hypothetical protein